MKYFISLYKRGHKTLKTVQIKIEQFKKNKLNPKIAH